jgi:hypothetical protein
MAKPQFFISSTYFDLKTVRDDLARFLKELGYDSIRHEVGAVPYARSEKLESSCYREVSNCDVLICIVGGRYGSTSSTGSGSITQNELKSAFHDGKQVYIFVERSVHTEWHFFQKNKNTPDVVYSSVDGKEGRKVFEFLDEISQFGMGNPIFPFETSTELTFILREQLAGLFKRLLTEETQKEHKRLFEELKSSITTVGELAKYLSAKSDKNQDSINAILITEHPIFIAIKKAVGVRYRVFFTDLSELDQWVASARKLKPVDVREWDDLDYREWFKRETDTEDRTEWLHLLKIKKSLFDENGRLIPMSPTSWNDSFLTFTTTKLPNELDDDIPF